MASYREKRDAAMTAFTEELVTFLGSLKEREKISEWEVLKETKNWTVGIRDHEGTMFFVEVQPT